MHFRTHIKVAHSGVRTVNYSTSSHSNRNLIVAKDLYSETMCLDDRYGVETHSPICGCGHRRGRKKYKDSVRGSPSVAQQYVARPRDLLRLCQADGRCWPIFTTVGITERPPLIVAGADAHGNMVPNLNSSSPADKRT